MFYLDVFWVREETGGGGQEMKTSLTASIAQFLTGSSPGSQGRGSRWILLPFFSGNPLFQAAQSGEPVLSPDVFSQYSPDVEYPLPHPHTRLSASISLKKGCCKFSTFF